jgi:fibronectin type 3 domain-containing protein
MRRTRLCLLLTLAAPVFLASCAGVRGTGGTFSPESEFSARELESVGVSVSQRAKSGVYRKAVLLPFQSPAETGGEAVSRLFAAELLKTSKYRLVGESQMEEVLGERSVVLEKVQGDDAALRAGKALGVEGVIVGTVPEYGLKMEGAEGIPSLAFTVRMLDVSDGSDLWTVSHRAVSPAPADLKDFTERQVRLSVARLEQEWVRTGDSLAADLPAPQVSSYGGELRGARVEVITDPLVKGYRFFRARSKEDTFQEVATLKNAGEERIVFSDRGLQDLETYYYLVAGVTGSGLTGEQAGPFRIITAGPPDAVTGFTAESGIIREVPLSWQPLENPDVKGYKIFRRRHEGKWAGVRSLKGGDLSSFTDTRLDDGETYEYRIIAFNRAGVEGPPTLATAVTKGPPSAVITLEAGSNHPRQVPLYWEPVREPEVKGYNIYRSEGPDGPFKPAGQAAGRDTESYLDQGSRRLLGGAGGLEDGRMYFYRIRALNLVGLESGDSPLATAVTKPVPAAVAALQAGQLEVRMSTLTWQLNPEKDIDRYEIFLGTRENSVTRKTGEVSRGEGRYADEGLEDGRTYYYRVRAVDVDGLIGGFSPVVSSKTKPVPRRPGGLAAVEDGGSILLTWHENPERDIARYLIFRSGILSDKPLGEAALPPFIFQPQEGGTYRLRVRAVDADGLESPPSEPFTIKVKK